MSTLLCVATFIASLFPLLDRAFISDPPHYSTRGLNPPRAAMSANANFKNARNAFRLSLALVVESLPFGLEFRSTGEPYRFGQFGGACSGKMLSRSLDIILTLLFQLFMFI